MKFLVHCLTLAVSAFACAQTAPTSTALPRLAALDQRSFLQLLVARSVEVRFSQLSGEVTRSLMLGEAGLYETVFFATARDEGRDRQRTADERAYFAQTANTLVLDEKVKTQELGIRNKLPWGSELSVSYKKIKKTNNLIPNYNTNGFDTDYNALLNLTLKQPLLRNMGRDVTETDRFVAELEHQIALHQLTQQTEKAAIEGLSLFWQLYRAEATLTLRNEALAGAQSLLSDAQARVLAGRLPASAVQEIQAILLNRQAEWLRSQQALRDAQGKLATALHLVWGGHVALGTRPVLQAFEEVLVPAADEPGVTLNAWSPYKVALLKLEQAEIRQRYAKNQTLPLVDLVLNYGGTGYDYNANEARKAATKARFPDWYVGLNFELPLDGNQKAKHQWMAQNSRRMQAELEVNAVKISFLNDLTVHYSDLVQSRAVLLASHEDVAVRQNLLNNEYKRHELGVGLLGSLVQRQIDLTESKQRLLENQIRFEMAFATWQYTQGRLLSGHQIRISHLANPTL